MKMRTRKIIYLFLLFCINANAQYIGSLEISKNNIKRWLPKLEIEYSGIYNFGESESESDLILFFSGNYLIGQIKSGYWEKGTSKWKWKYENLKNIKIDENGNFTSDKYSGQFVTYKDENIPFCHGLKINNPWTDWIEKGKFEIGIESVLNFKNIYTGKYPEASFRILSKEKISKLRKNELQILKNEIFARYGFIFRTGSEMDKYFNKQSWYVPMHKNVNLFLNEIEIKNLKLINSL